MALRLGDPRTDLRLLPDGKRCRRGGEGGLASPCGSVEVVELESDSTTWTACGASLTAVPSADESTSIASTFTGGSAAASTAAVG